MKRAGRKSLIGGIVALSLILVGTGYAYWTDTLNVTTKATTGDLDVTFVDLGLYAQYNNETNPNGWSIVDGIGQDAAHEGDGYVGDMFFARGASDYNSNARTGSVQEYKNSAQGWNSVDFDAQLVDPQGLKKDVGPYLVANTHGSDSIELSVSNMYPGYAQAFRSDIINQGSIAAKLSTMKFDIGALDQMTLTDTTKSMLGIAIFMNKDDDSTPNVFQLCTNFASGDNYFTVGGVDFLRLSALEGLSQTQIDQVIQNANLKCNPEYRGRMDIFLAVAMDPDAEGTYTTGSTAVNAENDDTLSQKNGAVISIDFGWDQFNANVSGGSANILEGQNAAQNPA